MSYFGFLASMAKVKLGHLTETRQEAPVRTQAPLNLSQTCVVELSPVPYILAQAAGARMEPVAEKQIVVAVGALTLFGTEVFRSYLSDGRSFIQTVVDPRASHGVGECRLYTSYMEDAPADADAWAFFLADEDGYIGYPMFDIKDGTRFWRMWSPGETRIAPLMATESIVDAQGGTTPVRHRMMQYGRRLGDTEAAVSEYLLVAAVEHPDGASFNAWLGIDVAPDMLQAIG